MQKKNKSTLPFLGFVFVASSFTATVHAQVRDKWNGVVHFSQKLTGDFIKVNEKNIDVTIRNSMVTDSVVYKADHSLTTAAGTVINKKNCEGKGTGELHAVDISGGEYYVHIVTHTYNCTSVSIEEGSINFTEQSDITFTGTFFNANHDVLSGSDTTTVETGAGEAQTIITWFLSRAPIDVELIVTPESYNTWMPEPGKDEQTKGNVMSIGLKVQKRNGQPATMKVDHFELTLYQTSKEKGITINMPLSPAATQLPDLRFIPVPIGESNTNDQFISVNSPDGVKGTAYIASYDGGGWTTLTAVAVLDAGIRIEGTLLVPTGVKEIPIPKRNANSKIATAWLAANGNPGDMDDKEKKAPNPNIGDGLTAYEEYRGVISEGKFKRLKPAVKELGVMVKKGEVTLFEEGIKWLENASALKIILFDETEIGSDRKLNKNFNTSHDYNQYVLKLENASLGGDAVGENQPESIQEKVPRQSEKVVIAVDKIRTSYQSQAAAVRAANLTMPYTEEEELANTVAHELGHGIHMIHHGKSSAVPARKAYENHNPRYHIYWINSNSEETARPYPPGTNDYLEDAGVDSCDASGDLSCIMAYTSNYNWAFRTSKTDGSLYYYKVPLLPVGKKLCTSKTGTGINAPSNRGINNVNKYFGNAENGNCLNQIKLRD